MPDEDPESDLTRSVLDHLAVEADPDEADPDEADLDEVDLDEAVAALQEAPHETPEETPQEPPQSVAKIWDRPRPAAATPAPIERPLTRVVQPEPTMSAAPRRPDRSPETPRGVTSERVKTRLLGFHGAAAEADLFEAAPERGAGAVPFFPIGWLVVVDGPGRGASFTLAAGLSTIGRDADQTVPLDYGDTSISRERHVSIAYDAEDKRTWVGHGGKSNIVRLNDKPLLSTEELNHGDLIRVGKTSLRYVALCDATFDWGDAVEDEDTRHG
ncbi:FHA domain-containing protein [Aestuariicoccus sp. KMU-90]|uniref:FHA domain-containing protein n=2 Tax=Thetidibacter halocola TaxID=2827239 RepID=A0A8J7WEM2_9RHOB|nr:FHA domain-containing protein [Thetidibacter halocola]